MMMKAKMLKQWLSGGGMSHTVCFVSEKTSSYFKFHIYVVFT